MPVEDNINAPKSHLSFPSRGRGVRSDVTSCSSSTSVGGSAQTTPAVPASPSNFEDADSDYAMDTTTVAAAAGQAAAASIAASGLTPELVPAISTAITTAITAAIGPALEAVADNAIRRFAQSQQQQQQQQIQQQQLHQPTYNTERHRTPKLPPFDATNVALWLGSAETEFEICRVSDPGTKRAHVLAAIPKEHRLLFQDFLLSPDTTLDGYVALVNHVRNLFQEKPRQRAARILQPHNLKGRTPSQFLAALKAEMADMTLDMIAKEILAGVLPANIRAIVTTDTNSPGDMANAADAFFSSAGELLEQTHQVCMATPATTSAPVAYEAEWDGEPRTEAEVTPAATPTFPATTPAYVDVCAAYRGPQRSRNRLPTNTSRPQSQGNFRQNNDGRPSSSRQVSSNAGTSANLCFYHRRFGTEARKCREGCPHWGNARAGGLM